MGGLVSPAGLSADALVLASPVAVADPGRSGGTVAVAGVGARHRVRHRHERHLARGSWLSGSGRGRRADRPRGGPGPRPACRGHGRPTGRQRGPTAVPAGSVRLRPRHGLLPLAAAPAPRRLRPATRAGRSPGGPPPLDVDPPRGPGRRRSAAPSVARRGRGGLRAALPLPGSPRLRFGEPAGMEGVRPTPRSIHGAPGAAAAPAAAAPLTSGPT